MAKNTEFDAKEAEVFGKIKTLPTIPTAPEPVVEPDKVAKTPTEFQDALARAQFATTNGEGKDYVIVDDQLFRFLMKNHKGTYLTYGDPGVKVYLEGKKEEADMIEAMTAEEAATYQAKKKKNG